MMEENKDTIEKNSEIVDIVVDDDDETVDNDVNDIDDKPIDIDVDDDEKQIEADSKSSDDKTVETLTENTDDKTVEAESEDTDNNSAEVGTENSEDKPADKENSEDKTSEKENSEDKTSEKENSEDKSAEDIDDNAADKSSEDAKKSFFSRKNKKLYFAAAAAAVVILAVLIIVFAGSGKKKKSDPAEIAYYTFSEVQKDVAYLANDKEQQDKLNRLIDPMKKSNPVDADYVNSIADIIGVDKAVYKSIIKGYSGKDKLPQSVFNEFYDAMISSGKVEGIKTTDVFIHSMSGTEYGITMISDGYKTYETDNVRIDGESMKRIISFYEKNGTIFKAIGLSEAEHTVTNVLMTGIDTDAKTVSFLLNGDEVTVKDPENKAVKELVVNITFTNNGIKNITPSGEEISGRITAVNASNIKVNDHGFYYYDDDYKVYDKSGEEPKEVNTSQFLVGYKSLKIYVEDRKVKAVVITDSELDSEEIRVLINDTEYKGYQLKDVTFSCSADYTITFSNGSSEEKSSDRNVMFTPASFGMHESVTLSCNDPEARFTIESIERNGIHPSYRGTFEVVMMGDFLYIINKLPIEEYLYAVVSSELSDSYDDETFKAFAIVARGYACKMMEDNQFASYGADIDDSNSTLLYNYYPETERSIMIVNETYGIVPAYEDKIIMPYHFLTSCGVTCTNTDIYSEDEQPYYGANFETIEKEETKLSSEKAFKDFIDKGNDYDILEVDEPYYRWYIHYTDKEMTDAVNSIIDERIKNTVDTVLVLEKSEEKTTEEGGKNEENTSDNKTDGSSNNDAQNGNDNSGKNGENSTSEDGNGSGKTTEKYNSKYSDILENGSFVPAEKGTKLGDIIDIAVVSRSEAGVVKELLIIGSQNTIWVKGQTNVRYIFNPFKQIIKKNDGSEVEGYSLMPSPFYYVEKTSDGYQICGGGFGNGVGLSLSGARILSEMGYNYEEIIKHYYNNVQLRNMFGLYDKDADNTPDDESSIEATTEG